MLGIRFLNCSATWILQSASQGEIRLDSNKFFIHKCKKKRMMPIQLSSWIYHDSVYKLISSLCLCISCVRLAMSAVIGKSRGYNFWDWKNLGLSEKIGIADYRGFFWHMKTRFNDSKIRRSNWSKSFWMVICYILTTINWPLNPKSGSKNQYIMIFPV